MVILVGHRADDQVLGGEPQEGIVVALSFGQIDLGLAGAVDAAEAHVADDADDGAEAFHEREAAAERVLVGPVLSGEGFADDGDEQRRRRVGVAHVAALAQGDAHGGEVAGRDEADAGLTRFRVLRRLAFGDGGEDAAAEDHRQEADVGRVGDMWQ